MLYDSKISVKYLHWTLSVKSVLDAKCRVCSNAGKATIKLELELGDVLLRPVAHRVPSLLASIAVKGDRKHGVKLQLKKLLKVLRKF
jgi:hypothetical protein